MFSAILPKFNLLFQQFFQFAPTVELIYLSPYFNKPLNSLIAFLCKFVTDYRTISSSQMSNVELACTLPWREIEGEANISSSQMSKGELACTLPWREIEGEANISSSQMSRGELACTLPWREIEGTANFKRDFLKAVDFVHYLKAEGYDMVTFDKVGNINKP